MFAFGFVYLIFDVNFNDLSGGQMSQPKCVLVPEVRSAAK